ncbi:sugar transporter [Thalassococcus sp. BH17M4-6]|uniref:sugar transporter n=1 Tax=Thalassococcus sp. BH17M4-6 TaxID=3413148 RepID=UPI003BBDF10D
MEETEQAGDGAKTAPAPKKRPAAVAAARPPAGAAQPRRRHYLLLLTFLLWVLAPLTVSAVYLYGVAADQYASHVGFSVRKEEVGSAVELLGGITELSGSSSSDTDILYEFIQSQQMVRAVDARLNLRAIYTKPEDPVFGLSEDVRIEALSDYWGRMVKVFYDSASGLIEIRVLAFEPQAAQDIAQAVFEESSNMINQLSTIARADATRYAKEELEREQARLRTARQALTAFRSRTRIVDPTADIQGQMGLLNSLQAKLADAIIERELLLESSSSSDPRVLQAQKKIEVIEAQIDEERGQFGNEGDADFSRILAEYEALQVDREFAEKSYLSAQATYDAALAEAQRQSRYLATHIDPTLAETAQYPHRLMLTALIGAFLFISWAIMAMAYYSLRDRR